jgi:hypothetical protein
LRSLDSSLPSRRGTLKSPPEPFDREGVLFRARLVHLQLQVGVAHRVVQIRPVLGDPRPSLPDLPHERGRGEGFVVIGRSGRPQKRHDLPLVLA